MVEIAFKHWQFKSRIYGFNHRISCFFLNVALFKSTHNQQKQALKVKVLELIPKIGVIWYIHTITGTYLLFQHHISSTSPKDCHHPLHFLLEVSQTAYNFLNKIKLLLPNFYIWCSVYSRNSLSSSSRHHYCLANQTYLTIRPGLTVNHIVALPLCSQITWYAALKFQIRNSLKTRTLYNSFLFTRPGTW